MRWNILLVAILWPLTAPRAGAESLSRAQAVTLAIAANPEVERAREDLRLLEARVREARADALPEISLIGSAIRYRDPALLNSSSFDTFPPELRAALTPIPANLFEGIIQVRQTVFSFKLGRAIQAARYGLPLGREGVRRGEHSVTLHTIRAYNNYLLSLEKVAVAEKSARLKERHLEMARNRRAAGVATDLDVLRSEVDLENQRVQLVQLRREAELARGALNVAMVRPIDTPVEPSDTLGFEPLEITQEEVVRRALLNRPEMKTVRLSEEIYGELIGIAQADSRPRADFNAVWGYSVREPRNFFESNFQKWTTGLTLTVPIFDGFRTAAKVAQTRAERSKIVQQRVELENAISLDAKDAVDRITVARRVLQATELNVTQAERALDMTQANYNQGAATTLDVLDAQQALTLAESLRIEALHDHANARATVRYVMGDDFQ